MNARLEGGYKTGLCDLANGRCESFGGENSEPVPGARVGCINVFDDLDWPGHAPTTIARTAVGAWPARS